MKWCSSGSKGHSWLGVFGDPIRNNAPWNIPYHSQQSPVRNPRRVAPAGRRAFLTVSVLRPSVSSLGQDFQLGSQRGASSQWVVSFHTASTTHIHSAPVMLGRFQPAASERSALEFLRPKEISNWVMDMVTCTMRRQKRRRSGEKEGERHRTRVWNTIWVHYLSPLPMTDLGCSVPKQTYLGIKEQLRGVSQGQLN